MMMGRAELVCCRATERPKFGLVQLNFEEFLMVSIHRLALLWKAKRGFTPNVASVP